MSTTINNCRLFVSDNRSDRTIYQRNYMKKFREELEFRRSSDGENELIIKNVRSTPTIVSRNDCPNTRDLDSVYTDFQKAFDEVQQHLLKISTFGIHGHFLKWLWSYLNC
ncbi:hypothetical protein QTP88_013116 [Uroleucon formosanum]